MIRRAGALGFLIAFGFASSWSCSTFNGAGAERGGSSAATTNDGGANAANGSSPNACAESGTCGNTNSQPSSGSGVVLQGGWVVDPSTRKVTQHDLYICAGIIVDQAHAQGCTLTPVDVSGKWLIPGLSDMHVHARGVSLGNGDFRNIPIDVEASTFRLAGVTSVLDGMNDEAKIFPVRDEQRAQAIRLGADIFCAGGAFTPTGGHGTEYGLPKTSYRIVDTVEDVAVQMADLEKSNPDIVKIFYDHRGADGGPDVADGQEGALGIAMKKEVMVALVAAANARNLKTEVHIGVWNDARDAIAAGATLIAHLGEPAIPDDVIAMARENHVFWMPTMSLYHGFTDIIADQTLLDDPLLSKVATPNDINSYRTNQLYYDDETMSWLARHTEDAANVQKLLQGGVKLLAGTDVVELGMFIGWSLHRELVLSVDAGLSTWDALATATTNAGEFLGRDYGIEPGAEGNVIVLDASPIDDIWNTTKIQTVFHHGSAVTAP